MASFTDREKELVAIGASIGAGCQLCTLYHVGAALKSGLTQEEVSRAIDDAQDVRAEGGIVVSNLGRNILGVEHEPAERLGEPKERGQALVYIGGAAGCNAGSLLAGYIVGAVDRFGLSAEELRSALEMAEVVKQRAADFLRRDVERALRDTGKTAAVAGWSSRGADTSTCCGPTG